LISDDEPGRFGTTTVPLAEPAPVDDSHDGAVTLDLAALEQRAQAAAEVTGLPASTVAVAVVATVAHDGGGEFAPRLELVLDALTLKPTGELTPRSESSTSGTRLEPAQLTALGRSIDVTTARVVALAAVLVALLAAAGVAVATRLTEPVAESERIRRRYGALILPVLPMALAPGRPVVDVPGIDALVTLAERYGLLVLTWSRGGVDTYVVQDEGTTFRYRSGTAVAAPASVLTTAP
jgi:hypothetical protein